MSWPEPPPQRPRRELEREESLLDRIAQGKRVIICELDSPKTLALDKFFAGAQALVKAGCDAITLADNSLAILRVSNLAIGAMMKERFGITPLLHLSCRVAERPTWDGCVGDAPRPSAHG